MPAGVSLGRLKAAARSAREARSIRPPAPSAPFNLSRRFAILGLLVIALVSTVSSVVLSRFLVREMLNHDALEAMQFIHSSVLQREAEGYFAGAAVADAVRQDVENYLSNVLRMPHVLRVQVYSAHGVVRWSSSAEALNLAFSKNDELDRALRGELAIESDLMESRRYLKPEHVLSRMPEKQFAEYYIPLWNDRRDTVLGAVEIYKEPIELFDALHTGVQLIWLCALGGGILMYGVLFWVVRRGHRIIIEQQRRIAGDEGFAAVGEIAAAVAHNIRNPLAAIRSSAELMAGQGGAGQPDFSRDIMTEVDRLEVWIRSLLNYAHLGSSDPRTVNINELLGATVDGMREDFGARHIVTAREFHARLPSVIADSLVLEQIVRTLLANAMDAMPAGGTLLLKTRRAALPGGADCIDVDFTDSGVGIAPDKLRRTFTEPSSTKPHGLGIGLPLVHRTLERMGGAIEVASAPGQGTRVTISIPLHSPEIAS